MSTLSVLIDANCIYENWNWFFFFEIYDQHEEFYMEYAWVWLWKYLWFIYFNYLVFFTFCISISTNWKWFESCWTRLMNFIENYVMNIFDRKIQNWNINNIVKLMNLITYNRILSSHLGSLSTEYTQIAQLSLSLVTKLKNDFFFIRFLRWHSLIDSLDRNNYMDSTTLTHQLISI